jgi:Copper transport outer membrane protein, MctB
MIDFRYHLVSIVAVFLALALGLLLGSTVLRPYALKGLQALSKHQKQQIDSLQQVNKQLQSQLAADNQFAQANAPQILHQLLVGQRVVLVLAPGAPSSVVNGVSQDLGLAGATVTGQLQLQAPFFDTSPTGREKLAQLAEQLAGQLPVPLPLKGSAQAQASELLANEVLTTDGAGQPVAGQRDSNSVAVINGLANAGFLTPSGNPWDRATLAIEIIPATPAAANDSNEQSQALVTLAQQLDLAGQGTVVAGSMAGSGPGSAIDVMRAGGRAGHLSSVDDADSPFGQMVIMQALDERMHGKSGSYGILSTANTAGPSPGPTPSPTPTLSPNTASNRAGKPVPSSTRSAKR